MTDNEIILHLTKENINLKKHNKGYIEALRNIYSFLVSIGGPLNDNVYKYNKNQLQIFRRIEGEIMTVDIRKRN